MKEDLDYLVCNEGDYTFTLNNNSKMWKLKSEHKASQGFMEYRDMCIEKAENLCILNKYEELALSGIMVIDDEIGDEKYVPLEIVEELLEDIASVEYFTTSTLDSDEKEIVEYIIDELKKRMLNYDYVTEYMDAWVQQKENPQELKKVIEVLRSIVNTYCINYCVDNVNEATLVRDTLDTLCRVYFPNTCTTKSLGADNQVPSSSSRFTNIDPSLVNHGKRTDFSVVSHREKHLLLALEAKRVGRTVSGDFMKLAKELKESLKEINTSGYKDAPVVGLLMKGCALEYWVMDHCFDGIYRMVLVDRITFGRDRYHLSGLFDIFANFKKMKIVASSSGRKVNRPHPDDEDLPANMVTMHTPIVIDRTKKLKLNPRDPAVSHARRKLF